MATSPLESLKVSKGGGGIDLESISSFTTSLASSLTDGNEEDEDIAQLNDDQLERLLEECVRSNHVMALETEVFDKSWKKLEEKEMTGVLSGKRSVAYRSPSNVANIDSQGASSRATRKRSKSRGSLGEKFSQRLTAEQKCDLAQKEIDRYKADIKIKNEGSERAISQLTALIKEAHNRTASVKQEAQEFSRDVARGAINPITKKVNPDKAAKFWQEKLHNLEGLNLKLRLKNTALKIRRKRVAQTLRQQGETGDILHEIDFAQLSIENQVYSEKIEERNQDLIHLKLMTSHVLTVLNVFRQKLNGLLSESKRLRTDIASRLELIRRIDNETAVVEDERLEAERINHKLLSQMEKYQVPETSYYVEAKADIYLLKKKLQTWKRKEEITSMALQTKRNAWRKLKRETLQKNDFKPVSQGVHVTEHKIPIQ